MSDAYPKKHEEPIDYYHEVAVFEHLETLKSYTQITYPQQNDIKRCATAIRFLLLEESCGLKKSAKLFDIPLLFDAHDIEPLEWQAQHGYVYSYASSFTKIFDSSTGAITESHPYREYAPHQYDIEKKISINLDAFLAQKILFNEGIFLTRHEVIKYICYTGGIHYGKKNIGKITKEKLNALENLENKASLTTIQTDEIHGQPITTFTLPDKPNGGKDFKYAPKKINLVFFEFHATINKINDSESIKTLGKLIQTLLTETTK